MDGERQLVPSWSITKQAMPRAACPAARGHSPAGGEGAPVQGAEVGCADQSLESLQIPARHKKPDSKQHLDSGPIDSSMLGKPRNPPESRA